MSGVERLVIGDDNASSSSGGPPWKLVVVARGDLGMSAGKMAAQVGHAVHQAIVVCSKAQMEAWESDGSMIIVLRVDGAVALRGLQAHGQRQGLTTTVVLDEGLTEVGDGEATALSFGPHEAERVNVVTGKLPLYKEDGPEELQKRLQSAEAELLRLRAAAAPKVDALRPGQQYLVRDLSTALAVDTVAEAQVPELFEQWCWEGDEMVLPLKWSQALEECCGASAAECSQRPWELPGFDRDGIFFLTHRSETAGIAVAIEARFGNQLIGVVAGWGVQLAFRRRGLGRCLLRLCLSRHAALGRPRVLAIVDQTTSPDAWKLLISEGFSPLQGP